MALSIDPTAQSGFNESSFNLNPVCIMKFLITWQIHEGKLHDTLSLFSKMTAEEEQAMMGDQIKLVTRWHDLVSGSGIAIAESDSAEALSAYALGWNASMDVDISVVVDDDTAKAIGSQLPAG